MIDIHNRSDVKEVLFFTKLDLLVGTDPTCQVQLRSIPKILLHQTLFFLCPYVGFLKSYYLFVAHLVICRTVFQVNTTRLDLLALFCLLVH